MEKEFICGLLKRNMMDIGEVDFSMAKELNPQRMERFIKVNGLMVYLMGQESASIRMEVDILANGEMGNRMARVLKRIQIILSSKDNGSMVKLMVEEQKLWLTKPSLRASGSHHSSSRVNVLTQMAQFTKVIGSKAGLKAKARRHGLMEKLTKDNFTLASQ